MADVFAFLVILSVPALIIGLIKPKLLGMKTRLKALLLCLAVFVVSFIGFGTTYESPEAQQAGTEHEAAKPKTQAKVVPAKPEAKAKPKAKPKPKQLAKVKEKVKPKPKPKSAQPKLQTKKKEEVKPKQMAKAKPAGGKKEEVYDFFKDDDDEKVKPTKKKKVVTIDIKLDEVEKAEKKSKPKPLTKEERAKARKDRISKGFHFWDGSHIGLERIIKDHMHDPDSFKHVDTVYWDNGDHLVVRTTFRGTNKFGAVVTGWVKAKADMDGNITDILDQGNR